MAVAFTPDPNVPATIQSGGSIYLLIGTLAFSGSYATGGDTFAAGQNLEDLFKRIGMGLVFAILINGSGYRAEWDAVNDKLKLYASGGTELAAAAYPAALTPTGGVRVIVYGR